MEKRAEGNQRNKGGPGGREKLPNNLSVCRSNPRVELKGVKVQGLGETRSREASIARLEWGRPGVKVPRLSGGTTGPRKGRNRLALARRLVQSP